LVITEIEPIFYGYYRNRTVFLYETVFTKILKPYLLKYHINQTKLTERAAGLTSRLFKEFDVQKFFNIFFVFLDISKIPLLFFFPPRSCVESKKSAAFQIATLNEVCPFDIVHVILHIRRAHTSLGYMLKIRLHSLITPLPPPTSSPPLNPATPAPVLLHDCAFHFRPLLPHMEEDV
jgi:hypothetical protein